MKLLIVRTGVNWLESDILELKKALEEKLPSLVILVLHGENENIETTFEIVHLY